MELVSGESLNKMIDEFGPLEENVIQEYTRQILEGLKYLHERNISHR